jgi:hypothetical protein
MLVVSAVTLHAQMTPDASRPVTPPGWGWTTDAPAEPQPGGTGNVGTTRFEFTPMAPGWHITMGPGGVLFPREARAEGRYALEGDMIYFPDGHAEAEYGVVVGASGLEGSHASWTAFVVRADGRAAVMRHEHGRTRMLLDWSAAEGVAGRDSAGWAQHRVQVRAEPDSVRFLINDKRVGAWPRTALVMDGSYGFRIGRAANLHITNLDLTRRLAPFPPPRP